METYKYKLQYIHEKNIVDYEFSGFVDIWELADHLKRFLNASGWDDGLLRKILNMEEK